MSPKLLIWVSVILSGVAQIFLKQGMITLQRSTPPSGRGLLGLASAVATQGYVWLWGLSFVAATGLWLLGLQRVDLSFAYPLVSFGYVLVSLLAALCFGERIGWNRWLAVLLICLGVTLIAGS